MLNFIQNLMQSLMNLVPAHQTYRKRSKILKNETVAKKRISTSPSSKVNMSLNV